MMVLNHIFDLQVLKYDLIVGICEYPACFVQTVLSSVSNLTIYSFKDNLLLIPVTRSLFFP